LLCSLHQPELARRFDRTIRVGGGVVVPEEPLASSGL